VGAIAVAQDRPAAEPAGGRGLDVFNSIEGHSVVVASRPDGALVEKGEVVCELDASELHERLAVEEIVVRSAEAGLAGARLAREAAEMGLVQYVEGQFQEELTTIAGETNKAKASLTRAEDHLAWSRRMFEMGYATQAERVADELALRQAVGNLEVAESRKTLLVSHTKGRTITSLKGKIETARSRELAKQAVLEREKLAHKRLTDRIRRCKITAPAAGRVRYTSPIGAGAVVTQGQLIFRIVPDGTTGPDAR
jgi:multidrug resistance efflux pump